MMTLPTLVIISSAPWDGVTQRPHHIAKRLALTGWNVLFVDPPVTWISPVKNRNLLKSLVPSKATKIVPLDDAKGTLTVLVPIAQIPFGNMKRWINRLNQRLLARQIRSSVKGPMILFSVLANTADLLAPLRPIATLYDCVDLHSGFPGFIDTAVVDDMEEDLVHLSRIITATADGLVTRMKRLHADVRLVPNAAEISHFQTCEQSSLHPLLQTIPEPRVGLIGGIGEWVDLDFISQMAKARPHVQFVMVGPVETDINNLKSLPNVHFLGKQPYDQLPSFLKGFFATLVSFKLSELAINVNPIKAYEYLAAGKEVVSTAIPEMVKLDKYVWICRNGEEGAATLDHILAGETRCPVADKKAFASEQSWDARATAINDALHEVVPHSKSL